MQKSLFLSLDDDLRHIVEKLRTESELLRGKTILITGATGFFGKWLLLGLVSLNRSLALNLKILASGRDPQRFLQEHPGFSDCPELAFVAWDVTQPAEAAPAGSWPSKIDMILHAATPASDKINRENPQFMFQTIALGMQNVLELAQRTGTTKLHLVSSGAVYGPFPEGMSAVSETYSGGPLTTDPRSAYGEGKRVSELLATFAAFKKSAADPMTVTFSRCFAFVGPFLPLSTHFAVGNFILNGLTDQPIRTKGNTNTVRSYMYASDLVIWLVKIMLQGKHLGAYNVGSDHNVTMAQLADSVATAFSFSKAKIIHEGDSSNPLTKNVYAPDIAKAKAELGLAVWIDHQQAIQKTRQWHLETSYYKREFATP